MDIDKSILAYVIHAISVVSMSMNLYIFPLTSTWLSSNNITVAMFSGRKEKRIDLQKPLQIAVQSPVRYIKFKRALKGFSSKTLAVRLKELQESGILERQAYNEIPPRVEYRLTIKGQELVESVISLLQWMKKWSKKDQLIYLELLLGKDIN